MPVKSGRRRRGRDRGRVGERTYDQIADDDL